MWLGHLGSMPGAFAAPVAVGMIEGSYHPSDVTMGEAETAGGLSGRHYCGDQGFSLGEQSKEWGGRGAEELWDST